MEEVNKDAKYVLCFAAVTVVKLVQVLYSVYLVLWIASFIQEGVLENDAEAKTIYKNVLTIMVFSALIAIPLIGKLADMVSA